MKKTESKGKACAKCKAELVPVAPVAHGDTASTASGTASASSSSEGLRDFEDAAWEMVGSTSNSTAAIEARLKAEQKAPRKRRMVGRSFSKTMYPGATSSDSSSSVNAKSATGGRSICNSAFVYPAVAIIVTVLVTGAIMAALRREGANADEQLRTGLPKKATSSLTECPCNGGASSTPADPEEDDVDSEQPDTTRHRPTRRRRRRSSVEHSTALGRGRTPDGVRAEAATNASEATSSSGTSEREPSNGVTTTQRATEGKRHKTATRSHRRRGGSGSTHRSRRVDSPTTATTLGKKYRSTTTVGDDQFSEWAVRAKGRNAVANTWSTTGDRIKNGKAKSLKGAPVTKPGNVSASRVEPPTERGADADVRRHQRDADGTTRGKRRPKRRKRPTSLRTRRSKSAPVT
ncbi:serine/arginine repetitive matrix protein 2-like [Dermacentor albipictus]|uniref:serine/arginine repetitive matrix protein 2-like n=1 Tax=Dermacentor albipictus TaxID=60249 RepID=UPI0031FBE1B6